VDEVTGGQFLRFTPDCLTLVGASGDHGRFVIWNGFPPRSQPAHSTRDFDADLIRK